jgi:hypothetical protein
MSMGNIAGAYFTVAIAIHTFNSLVLRFRQSAWIGILVISIGWAVALSVSLIPLSPALEQGSMYGPGDLTCGVRSIHLQALFYHHLFPVRGIYLTYHDYLALTITTDSVGFYSVSSIVFTYFSRPSRYLGSPWWSQDKPEPGPSVDRGT